MKKNGQTAGGSKRLWVSFPKEKERAKRVQSIRITTKVLPWQDFFHAANEACFDEPK